MPKPPKIPPLANLRSTAKPLATHFTPTVPYAESKLPPTGRSSSTTVVDFRNPKSSETPRERVARLREAARRARMQGLPWQDRMIETGRVYMDYAHRGFVMFLIGVAGTFNLLGFWLRPNKSIRITLSLPQFPPQDLLSKSAKLICVSPF